MGGGGAEEAKHARALGLFLMAGAIDRKRPERALPVWDLCPKEVPHAPSHHPVHRCFRLLLSPPLLPPVSSPSLLPPVCLEADLTKTHTRPSPTTALHGPSLPPVTRLFQGGRQRDGWPESELWQCWR